MRSGTGDDGRREALVVIDLQADYFDDDELERCREDLVATVNRLAAVAHRCGVPVLEVRTVHAPDRSTWTITMLETGQGIAVAGTPGAEPVAGLDLGDALIVTKTRDSAFFGTDLAEVLREQGVERVALVGISTESCVAATAADAFAHDLRVIVVSDATAAITWSLHDDALERLRKQYNQEVLTSEEVERRWQA